MERKDVLHLLTTALDPDMTLMQRKLPRAKFNTGGRTTNLTQAVWFEFVFELNEKNLIMANYSKVLTDRVILANWIKEFEGLGKHPLSGKTIGGSITSGKFSIGSYRNKCRLGRLYDNQPKPILMPFKYCAEGYPCKEKNKSVIALDLNQCRELCLSYRIADPRFFSPKEIADIKNHAEKKNERSQWGIPSRTQWEELNDSVPGGIYGRYNIYNKAYSEDWSPLTW
jgi:hypothetical protein